MARKPAKKAVKKATPKKRGAKGKYTADRIGLIEKALRLGCTYKLACSYAGIAFETFNTWRSEKPEFSDLIKKAEGEAAVRWLQTIEDAASDGAWQASAWRLERRYPQDYGKGLKHSGETQPSLILHMGCEHETEERSEKPVEIPGLRLHLGE